MFYFFKRPSFWLTYLQQVVVLLACALFPVQVHADVQTRQIAPGVTLVQEITTGTAPLVVNVLRVNLHQQGVSVQCGQANDAITLQGATKGREPLQSLAARHNAAAAINADFFPFTGDPLGLAIRDGELLSEPTAYRACMGISKNGVQFGMLAPFGTIHTADEAALTLDGVNRFPHDGDTIALTPAYHATPRLDSEAVVVVLRQANLPLRPSTPLRGVIETVSNLPKSTPLPACPPDGALLVAAGRAASILAAHCKPGDNCQFRLDLIAGAPVTSRGVFASRAGNARAALTPLWTGIEQAVGGGPWLVRNSQIYVDGTDEQFGASDFIMKRHPRSAAGVTQDGTLLLVVVDGRQPFSQGASLPELAAIMKRLGAVNAINFDGGGSSTLVVQNGIVNAPSDGRARPIADGLLVYADTQENEEDATQTVPVALNFFPIRAGASVQLTLPGRQGEPSGATWGTRDGFGFVSQRGVFTAYHSGDGTVVARMGNRTQTLPVRVIAAEPATLVARLLKTANNPPDRNIVSITLTDRYGNPVVGQQVQALIAGGQLQSPLVTNANGKATTEVVWDAAPPLRRILAYVGSVRATPLTMQFVKPIAPPKPLPLDPDDRP